MLDTRRNSSVTISIDKLYARLRNIGLARSTVRKTLLPDWWCDEFEQREGAVFEAAAYISRNTGLAYDDLIDSTQELSLTQGLGLCFKKRQDTNERELVIAACIAEQAMKLVAYACPQEYRSVVGMSPQVVREEILSKYPWVTLESLLDFCWKRGLAVVHFGHLLSEKGIKKFDGAAGIFEGHPVITTAKNHKSSAWMAFIVAHELGHIVYSHATEERCLVDERISPSKENDKQEQEADRFAVELIYGKVDVNYMRFGLATPNKLVEYALRQAEIDQVYPGAIILNYGWHSQQQASSRKKGSQAWAISQKAVQILEQGKCSAIEIIMNYLNNGIEWDVLSDESANFLERMVGIE